MAAGSSNVDYEVIILHITNISHLNDAHHQNGQKITSSKKNANFQDDTRHILFLLERNIF